MLRELRLLLSPTASPLLLYRTTAATSQSTYLSVCVIYRNAIQKEYPSWRQATSVPILIREAATPIQPALYARYGIPIMIEMPL
jgi:hypothetical protein